MVKFLPINPNNKHKGKKIGARARSAGLSPTSSQCSPGWVRARGTARVQRDPSIQRSTALVRRPPLSVLSPRRTRARQGLGFNSPRVVVEQRRGVAVVAGSRGHAGVVAAATTVPPNDGGEQHGRDGAVDGGGVPVVKWPSQHVSGVRGGPVNTTGQKWQRKDV